MSASKRYLPETLEGRGATSDAGRMEAPDLAGLTGAPGVAEVAIHLTDPSAARAATVTTAVDADDTVFHTGEPVVGLPAWFVQRMTPSKLKDVLTAVLNAMHFRRRGHEGKFYSVPLLRDRIHHEHHDVDEAHAY